MESYDEPLLEECDHGRFFRVYADKEPDDTVYIGVCSKCGLYEEVRASHLEEVFT